MSRKLWMGGIAMFRVVRITGRSGRGSVGPGSGAQERRLSNDGDGPNQGTSRRKGIVYRGLAQAEAEFIDLP